MKLDSMQAQISRIDRQRRTLEQKIQELRQKTLTALPKQVGLESVDSLILALSEFASPALRARLQSAGVDAASPANAPGRSGSGQRARFSAELRDKIRGELEMGRKSVAQISREFGPSHPTIMGWKREWGMTHPRAKRGSGNGNGAK